MGFEVGLESSINLNALMNNSKKYTNLGSKSAVEVVRIMEGASGETTNMEKEVLQICEIIRRKVTPVVGKFKGTEEGRQANNKGVKGDF